MNRRVTKVREMQKLTPTHELERWQIVEYMLDDFGPFTYEVRKAEFSWDALKKDMENQEQGLKSIAS